MNQSQNTLEAKQVGDLFHQISNFILRLLNSVWHWDRNKQIDQWNRTKSLIVWYMTEVALQTTGEGGTI